VGSRGAQALLRMVAKALDSTLLQMALRRWRQLTQLLAPDAQIDGNDGAAEWVTQGALSAASSLTARDRSRRSRGREPEEEMWSGSSDSNEAEEDRQQTLLRLEVPCLLALACCCLVSACCCLAWALPAIFRCMRAGCGCTRRGCNLMV